MNQPIHKFEDLIELTNLVPDERIASVSTLLQENRTLIEACPASTKYHGAYVGGLIDHTVEVVRTARHLNQELGNECAPAPLTFCAIVHDLGKLGQPGELVFIPDPSGKDPFIYNDKVVPMHHELRTLWWLSQYNIQYSLEEMQAIYFHAGPYSDFYKTNIEKNPLVLILHSADNLVAKIVGV